jgi:hypothetical protein
MLLGSAYGKVGLDTSGVVSGVKQAISVIKEMKSTFELLGGGLKKLQNNFDTAKSAVLAARTELEKLKASKAAAPEIKAAAENLKKLEQAAEQAARSLRNAEMQIQRLQQATMAMGQKFQQVGATLTTFVTLPLLALGAASMKVASDFEETANKADVAFGDLADDVRKNAESADTALGMSAQKYLDYASSIQAALTAGGMGVAESAKLSEGAVKHFADLASFHNAEVADVSAAWQSAIRGQYEPIQKYFPFINDAYMKTFGIANGLIDANTKNLTANERAIIMNAIALDQQLNPALDDFAETSGGFANQTRIMQAQFENVLRTLGQNLLPIALQVVQALNSMLEKFNNMSPAGQKAILAFAALAAALGPVLSVFGTMLTIVSQLAGLFGAGGALATAGPVISAGMASIGAVITGTVLPALGALVAGVGPVLAAIAVFLPALALLYWAFSTNFMGITDTVKMLWFIIKFYFKTGMDYLAETVRMLGFIIKVKLQQAFTNMIAWFRSINWSQVGENISRGIALGILKGIAWIIDAARRAAQAALDAAKKTLGIKSPSKAFGNLGRMSGVGYVNEFSRAVNPNTVARSMTKVVNTSQTAVQNQTYNLASGLSIRDARRMQKDAEKAAINRMVALIGA